MGHLDIKSKYEYDRVVVLEEDESSEMACVYYYDRDELIEGMEGNYWDFHNGCHGMNDLPEFNSREELANILADKYQCEIIRKSYKYEY